VIESCATEIITEKNDDVRRKSFVRHLRSMIFLNFASGAELMTSLASVLRQTSNTFFRKTLNFLACPSLSSIGYHEKVRTFLAGLLTQNIDFLPLEVF